MITNSHQKIVQLESTIAETALVAMIRPEPSEIVTNNRLEFKDSYDNLDYLVYAILPLSSGNRVALLRHRHSPDPGTEICVRHEQKDIAKIISEVVDELGLDRDDITWIAPTDREPFDELMNERDKCRS